MNILIIGGGNVGYYLAKSLLHAGTHEIKIIEKERCKCAYVADRLDISVFRGDGTDIRTLKKAEAHKADIMVAITGRDEDNFIAAQLARNYFHVKTTIVKANNPKNIDIMKTIGADIVVSSINIITNLIEREVDAVSMRFITRMNMGNSSICEFIVKDTDSINGQPLSEIHFPPNTLVITILRKGKSIIPQGDTLLIEGDDVMIMTDDKNKKELQRMFSK
ncbi:MULTISPECIES: NAD-binding protein [Clostridiaceae]|uniref:Trk system potassium uptake protein TrkA n=1 Tax=Clostridium facile TaxID=2763035 RepID=A0ABR7IN75_9CLOT|nr:MULTISPECIES: NAD-binding protein [Clostridiaceae]MBC5786586.1 NAD-binding protein [Clostridium facile]